MSALLNVMDIPPNVTIQLDHVYMRYKLLKSQIRTFKEYAIRRIQGQIEEAEFLALKDVSLSVYKGEVFGLVGPNGAGKTTLLRLVARIMPPSQGRVRVLGKVAPLLAMGAGFHPELSGRENIFINGTMLGYTRKEMERMFESIVDFAELWDFIEVPLRSYSSGMNARLGFAVATESMPEVLIVDELLSVGDAAFQDKSLARIRSFQEHGATIFLVSHGMDTIREMCTRAAWIDHGEVRFIGEANEAVDRYLENVGC